MFLHSTPQYWSGSDFKPKNLEVNIDERCLNFEGKEELEEENGYSMRAFTRQFVLPKDVNLDITRSSRTGSGQLSVESLQVAHLLESGGRSISIEQIGKKTEENAIPDAKSA
ncbi:hypothetical protein KIN20_018791 [Parelaphostrongylus tenuis]|uniref:SHSP domain-containing protein n=1 Tax=Parelaphostrongylus tenuis TaxID=148309 RepID=A0AAD5N456_PARTN|nr:hypothetical protein KIN20_018791 [Parelaphostrongylus tenuis]